ncbi:MAG: hypothetical protein RMJ51_02325 [Candidatus Calescibacterium sp.]|nr:hypothetical protein [Candidatus Calescibacterium sp.]MCX7972334.1 hypothetical protein [bacterium]MDW8195062.1 hypothetical protein [Candidatus Calescibacterium sp.]
MRYIIVGPILQDIDIIKNNPIKKINCQEHTLKNIEEILTQQNLFTRNFVFILQSFEKLLEDYPSRRILELLEKTKNSNMIINLDNNLNSIRDEKIQSYLKNNFKLIDTSKIELRKDQIENFTKLVLKKYNISISENITEKVKIILKKTNNDFLIAERILDEIIFMYDGKILDIQEEMLDFIVSQYKDINLFTIVNIFLEILFSDSSELEKLRKRYELLLSYLNEVNLNENMQEVWGLIFSQIVAVIRIYNEYLKVGENTKTISNNLKMNTYRVSILMKIVRKLDYLVKHKGYSINSLISSFLESEIKIKTNQSNYIQEIQRILRFYI